MLVFFSVLYNPSENAIENIKLAISFGLKPVVYINSADPNYLKSLQQLNVVILGKNKNVGLGVAFAEFEEYFLATDQEYFIYFDQDTIVNSEAWNNILSTYKELFSRQDVGLVFYSSDVPKYPDFVINSGSLFSKSILIITGLHDRNLFLEGIDYEYCMRIRKKSLKIISTCCPGIDHDSLQDSFLRSVLGYKLKFRTYGAKRLCEFNKVHLKLLRISLLQGPKRDVVFLLRSFLCFNFKEVLSQLFLRIK